MLSHLTVPMSPSGAHPLWALHPPELEMHWFDPETQQKAIVDPPPPSLCPGWILPPGFLPPSIVGLLLCVSKTHSLAASEGSTYASIFCPRVVPNLFSALFAPQGSESCLCWTCLRMTTSPHCPSAAVPGGQPVFALVLPGGDLSRGDLGRTSQPGAVRWK